MKEQDKKEQKNDKTLLIVVGGILGLGLLFAVFVWLDYKDIINIPGNPVSNYFAEKATEESLEATIEDEIGGDANVEIDSEDESVSIETEDGNFYSSSADSWPSDMPDDVPEYSYGDVTYKVKTEYDEGEAWIVTIENTSSDDVSAYEATALSEGFETVADVTYAGSRMLNMSRGDLSLVVTFDDSEGTTSVEVVQE
jgi:hypothetical protein